MIDNQATEGRPSHHRQPTAAMFEFLLDVYANYGVAIGELRRRLEASGGARLRSEVEADE